MGLGSYPGYLYIIHCCSALDVSSLNNGICVIECMHSFVKLRILQFERQMVVNSKNGIGFAKVPTAQGEWLIQLYQTI